MNLRSLALVAAAVLAVSAFGQDINARLKTWKGKPAPAFKMTDIHGRTVTNKSLLGKVVVLDFWATWCAPCKKASPVMEKLYEKYGSRGLVVIGAEAPGSGGQTGAAGYAKEHKYKYTFTTNNDPYKDKLGIDAIPAFVIIGKDGRVAMTETGVPPDVNDLYKQFEKVVKPLLAR